MKHKLEALQSLMSVLSSRGVNKMRSRKPIVSIEVQRHDDLPEENMLHEKMESPLEEKNEEGELALSDDKDGRKAMMKRFGK